MKPTVSVIICNFNGNRYLARTLPLWGLTGAQQVLVADALSDEPPIGEAPVVLGSVRGGKNQAVNAAARQATGKFLVIADNDIEPTPTLIGDLIAHYHKTNAGIVTAAIINDGEAKTRFYGRSSGVLLFYPQRAYTLNDLSRLNGLERDIAIQCFLIRREEFLALGGFSELVPYGFDDTELSLHYKHVFQRPVILFAHYALTHIGISNRSSKGSGVSWSTHVLAQVKLPQTYLPNLRLKLAHAFLLPPYLVTACVYNILKYRNFYYFHGLIKGLWLSLKLRYKPVQTQISPCGIVNTSSSPTSH